MARVPVILRDSVADAYFVDATVAASDAQAAVEALTHTTGDDVYRYAGLSQLQLGGVVQKFHTFAFDRDAYAWLVGVNP